jgi:hypothetical protein
LHIDRKYEHCQHRQKAAPIRAWSQVHGVAMSMLEGQLAPDDRVIDAVIDGTEMWPLPEGRA